MKKFVEKAYRYFKIVVLRKAVRALVAACGQLQPIHLGFE